MYPEAVQSFAFIVEQDPADDYAQFGYGLAAAKIGDLESAVEHLALAAAMRPDINHYSIALRGARAALAANKK
jgi:tetratricopeptide (TPR) repeat protein